MSDRGGSQSPQSLYIFSHLLKLNFGELIYHLLKQSKNGKIIYSLNNESLGDNMATMIDVQFNCYINTVEVMREHEFKMMAI